MGVWDAISGWVFRYQYFALAGAVTAGTGTVLLFSRRAATNTRARPRRVLAAVFGALAVAALLVIQLAGHDAWIWLVAFIPTSLVLYQGLYLAIFKNKQFFDDLQDPPHTSSGSSGSSQSSGSSGSSQSSGSSDVPRLVPIMTAAWQEERRYYSSASLALRFALPACLLCVVGVTAAHCLIDKAFYSAVLKLDLPEHGKMLTGARLGLAGAYIYVTMYLGNRTFRRDVTPGAALWSALTLAIGPIFAAVLVFLAKPQQDDQWTAQIIPFAAGFSLRYVSDVVERSIRRLMGGAGGNSSRSAPLSLLRGVSKDVEERFAEEGIENVAQLAMANPQRLRRNTCFDKRQIIAWIDEALLMTYLPLAWQSLQAEGITGAIDLAWYAYMLDPTRDANADQPNVPAPNVPTQVPTMVENLAKRNKLDADSLWEVMQRMYSDQQVLLNWALYQLDDSEKTRQSTDAANPE